MFCNTYVRAVLLGPVGVVADLTLTPHGRYRGGVEGGTGPPGRVAGTLGQNTGVGKARVRRAKHPCGSPVYIHRRAPWRRADRGRGDGYALPL